MGQYWTFFNLDKEAIGLSKLQEWYFTSGPPEMVHDTLLHGENSWAGDRIICLGDCVDLENVPAGVFSKDELEELGFEEGDSTVLFLDELSSRTRNFESPNRHRRYREHFFDNYVLGNLSKKEYIRGDNAPRADEYGESSMGRALFTNICCSYPTSAPENMEIEGFSYFAQGMWAGDRFDLVLTEDVEEDLESNDWKDMSEYVKRHVDAILDIDEDISG
ncbi:hypothetical protein BDQ17DRAFT_1329405 [Cyathus striatus]|nr:hypothetical protein BDQ17DRAFT_1329405 [Cyathus striatus]